MPLWGLTGGIAAGKSTVAAELAAHGAIILDADQIVHDLQRPGEPVFEAIVERFGADVVASDGSLNRPALGAKVFGDPVALAELNELVHPAVRAESARRISAAFAEDPDVVVVYDVPLLVESRNNGEWELIVVADAPAELRVQRLIELRGMSPEEAGARVASQATDEQRRAVADVLIDTSGTLEHTKAQVSQLWQTHAQR